MSQTKNQISKKVLVVMALSLLAVTSFSCAKKSTGVRSQVKKTSSLNMNPTVTAQAEQTASAQKVLYKIASLTTPNTSTDPITVDFELLTPSNQYLPVTTSHSSSALSPQAVYQDTANNVQVKIESRCTADSCSKYYLLITVMRNGTSLFQTGAVSYKDDCYFYTISVSNGFAGIDALQNYVATSQYGTPRNDCPLSSSSGSGDQLLF